MSNLAEIREVRVRVLMILATVLYVILMGRLFLLWPFRNSGPIQAAGEVLVVAREP